MKTTNS